MAHAQTRSIRNEQVIAVPQSALTPPEPSWQTRAANAHGTEATALRVPTRELTLNIAMLAAWLNNPAEVAKLDTDALYEMQIRLGALRDEFARRQRQQANSRNSQNHGARTPHNTARKQTAH